MTPASWGQAPITHCRCSQNDCQQKIFIMPGGWMVTGDQIQWPCYQSGTWHWPPMLQCGWEILDRYIQSIYHDHNCYKWTENILSLTLNFIFSSLLDCLGILLGSLGILLGSLGSLLGSLGKPSWIPWEAFMDPLKAFLDPLGSLLGSLGSLLNSLGNLHYFLGSLLESLGSLLNLALYTAQNATQNLLNI